MQKDKGSLSLSYFQDNIFHKANTRESGGEGEEFRAKMQALTTDTGR